MHPLSMKYKTGIVWLRRDLRLKDNPALTAAVESCERLILLYIWSPDGDAEWSPGGASRYWLHHSLAALQTALAQVGGELVFRRGAADAVLSELVRSTHAAAVFVNRLYEPGVVARDAQLQKHLARDGVAWHDFAGHLLKEPRNSVKADGSPYQVYSAFARQYADLSLDPELAAPAQIQAVPGVVGDSLDSLNLRPPVDWAAGIAEAWQPGENGAQHALDTFITRGLAAYGTGRDFPAKNGVSRLSPHLHFGEISVRHVWRQVSGFEAAQGAAGRESARVFRNELLWREFSHHLLTFYPAMPTQPLKPKFHGFPWEHSEEWLMAWQKGRTGYPIVDAGMRQLWQTGWMHNRVRMIVASFLVKDLRISWQTGQEWFWDTLVDADLAQNAMNWQWVAGCGADAAPYFRIFNPVLQGRKFDPDGSYVRQYVPELANMPARWIHAPWEAPAEVWKGCGLRRGVDYPLPVVDHSAARKGALEAYSRM